jgi:DNA helicase-2/ATP-dependent DNA helicase PcrA
MIRPMPLLLNGLNASQRNAAAMDGHLLIVAGPGTGKTLTIAHRIACLIHQNVPPEKILAVTFTNRAAREMRGRAVDVIGKDAAKIFIGTFHLLGLKIIKDNLADDFLIYSREEQVKLLKALMNDSTRKAQHAAERISRMKNSLSIEDPEMRETYEAYETALKQRNALDIDDLIIRPIKMLQDSETAGKYRDRFQHIIVDEYQDINPLQCQLLKRLSGKSGKVCVVGDADQAIYAFRGAVIENFLNFEKEYPGATRIVLSENYRSTGIIVNAADSLIKHSARRIDKKLAPMKEKGVPVVILSVADERAEATAIIQQIEERMGGTSHYQMALNTSVRGDSEHAFRFSDFAVIFRTHAQAKILEEVFAASGIPYQVIGHRSSEKVQEIDETIVYLQSLIHPGNTVESDSINALEAKLLTDADLFDPRAEAVTLMTLHMAKGLEFPVVFITGCEDGLLPCTIMKEAVDIEEERRLFYVGMTRAMDELHLLHVRNRFLYGRKLTLSPSPFLREIPQEFISCNTVLDRVNKQKEPDRQLGFF